MVKFSLSTPCSHKGGGGGVQVHPHSFLSPALDRCDWLTSCFCCFTPGEKPRNPLNKILFGPKKRSGRF